MPLSTVLGAQSLVQPAVCTTATRPASPYTGQAIYDTTTASQLIWNGTAWTGTGGLQLVTTATCSSGGTAVGGVVTIGSAVSSVTVATAFSSTYDNYKIIVNGGAASAGPTLQLVLGSTTTGYYWGGAGFTFAGASASGNQANFSSFDAGSAVPNGIFANIEISSPQLALRTVFAGSLIRATTTGLFIPVGGFLDNATQYTGFTLSPSSGTLTGGTIRVYGYQNS